MLALPRFWFDNLRKAVGIYMIKKVLAVLVIMSLAVFAASCGEAQIGTSDTKSASSEKAAEKETLPDTTAAEETAAEKTGFDKSKLKKDSSGFLTYSDGSTTSEIGIDVSSYSGEIDWNYVAESGVTFAIIRAGGRGYGDEGAMYSDESLTLNLSGASAVGIKTGVYFFSQAVTAEEAEEEADYVLNLIDGRNVTWVAYDFEHIKDDDARTDKVKDSEILALAQAFCDRIKTKGYKPLIYVEAENSAVYKDVADIPLWIAQYEGTPEITEQVYIWQYSKTGTIDGVSGSIDLNIMFERKQ